jgi:hypothetical protein
MKSLLLVLLFTLSTNIFARAIYCPQSITCTKQACYKIPRNFYVSSNYGNFIPGTTYYFNTANSMELMQVPYTCNYATGTKESGISITSRIPIKADTKSPSNNWVNLGKGPWANWGGIYFCNYNANHCPFMNY